MRKPVWIFISGLVVSVFGCTAKNATHERINQIDYTGVKESREEPEVEIASQYDLPIGWGICEGKFTLYLVQLENGKKAFHPMGELARGQGKLVWKDRIGKLHTFEFSDVDMCSVPGLSGWESVKPCIKVSERERVVLLDADPNVDVAFYKGRIMVLSDY